MNVGREIIPARTTARGEGDRGKRGTPPRPTHPDFLETENWIVACGCREYRELDSRNRCQSLRIVDRAPPFLILLLISSGVPRSRLPSPEDITHRSRSSSPPPPTGETPPFDGDKPLPSRGGGGNEIPRERTKRPETELSYRKSSKGANSNRPLDSIFH